VGKATVPRRFRNAAGPQIARVRGERSLTQEQLAAKLQLAGLDLDRISVAKIEARIRSVFDYELAVIANLLSVPVDALLPSPAKLKPMLATLRRGTLEL
jgi:transcriptional regulator with XRE-family HTH domain